MNTIRSFKLLLLAAASSLGLAGVARADVPVTTEPDVPPASFVGSGLLGQTLGSFNYSFKNLDNTGVDIHALDFEYSRPVEEGLDTFAAFSVERSTSFAGGRLKEYGFNFGGRFYRHYKGLKPYWEIGIGWDWLKAPGDKDNTFIWETVLGAEVPVATGLTLTPYVKFADAIDYRDGDRWFYGVKGNYWLNQRTALQAGLERQDDRSWNYRFGVNFRY